jgi:hypothetical protein
MNVKKKLEEVAKSIATCEYCRQRQQEIIEHAKSGHKDCGAI